MIETVTQHIFNRVGEAVSDHCKIGETSPNFVKNFLFFVQFTNMTKAPDIETADASIRCRDHLIVQYGMYMGVYHRRNVFPIQMHMFLILSD